MSIVNACWHNAFKAICKSSTLFQLFAEVSVKSYLMSHSDVPFSTSTDMPLNAFHYIVLSCSSISPSISPLTTALARVQKVKGQHLTEGMGDPNASIRPFVHLTCIFLELMDFLYAHNR